MTFWVHNLCDEDAAVTGAFTANPASRYDTVAGMLGLGPVVGLAAFGAVVTSHEPRSWGGHCPRTVLITGRGATATRSTSIRMPAGESAPGTVVRAGLWVAK